MRKNISEEERAAIKRDKESQKARFKYKARRFVRTLFGRKIVWIGFVGLMFFILIAIFANFIAPYDPEETDFMNRLAGMSKEHWLGTDIYGRDLLSRLIYGTRVSLIVGVLAVLVGGMIGSMFGMMCAYFGGAVDSVIMRIVEGINAIPQTILSMALIAIFGNSLAMMALILGVTTIPGYIRMMRASSLSIKDSDYVMAAKLQGASAWSLMWKHIFPNSLSPILVMMTQGVGSTIMMESGLSFMGVGIKIPTASWGSMVDEARTYLISNPLYALSPGIAVALLVISLNLFGDGIRDALDPRLRGES